MGLSGLIIAVFLSSPLYPISNGPRKSPSFSTIAIRNIPNQNHTSHPLQLSSPLIVVKKSPKNLFIKVVREQLC